LKVKKNEDITSGNIKECDFKVEHWFNEYTYLEAAMDSGEFEASIDIKDNYYLYYYLDKR
jgi:hypothetical protein